MSSSERFEGYMAHLAAGLGYVDRHAGLKGYCTGLMQPLSRRVVRWGDAATGCPVGGAEDGSVTRRLLDNCRVAVSVSLART